jgi:AmiR/NasT family two-component response regulator
MNRICLCIEQQEIRDNLCNVLGLLGYEVTCGIAQARQYPKLLSIVDINHLEHYASTLIYPILYVNQMTEEIHEWVMQHACIGVIDANISGFQLKTVVEVGKVVRRERETLVKENQKLLKKLQDRRIIDRAKFLLMRRTRSSEEDAYQRMRTEAMRRQKSLREIADYILLSEE